MSSLFVMRQILARRRAVLWQAFSMPVLRLTSIVTAALFASACFQSTTLIRISEDGSGTIEQTTLVTDAALKQLRQIAAFGSESGKPVDIFSTRQAREMAGTLGPGVTLVSSTRIKNTDGEGSRAIFAFSDINQLQIKHDAAENISARAPGIDPTQVHFALTHQSNGDALLRITMPTPTIPATRTPTAPPGSGESAKSHMAPEQLAFLKVVFAGMRIAIAVEPAGHLVNTNSPFVDGSRVTLLDFSFDQLLANDAVFARLQSARTIDDVKAAAKDIPGLRITFAPEISIEFTGKSD